MIFDSPQAAKIIGIAIMLARAIIPMAFRAPIVSTPLKKKANTASARANAAPPTKKRPAKPSIAFPMSSHASLDASFNKYAAPIIGIEAITATVTPRRAFNNAGNGTAMSTNAATAIPAANIGNVAAAKAANFSIFLPA